MYEYEVQFRLPGTDTTHKAVVTLLEQVSSNSNQILYDAIERQFGKRPTNISFYKLIGKK